MPTQGELDWLDKMRDWTPDQSQPEPQIPPLWGCEIKLLGIFHHLLTTEEMLDIFEDAREADDGPS